jgi:type IV secretory pathway TraG/TraD family ATPase VirD4
MWIYAMAKPPPPQNSSQPYRPPALSAALCIGWLYGAYWLQTVGLRGMEWGPLASLLAFLLSIKSGVQGIGDLARLKAHRKTLRRFAAGAEAHGRARFAGAADVAKSEYLSSEEGVYVGRLRTARGKLIDVYAALMYHISVIAPPGQNKTMAIVVPTLLSWASKAIERGGSLGNLIINDPSGEIYSIVRGWLEKLGYKLVVITPWAREVSELIGQQVIDAGLNIFSSITPEMDPTTVRDQLYVILDWVVPGKPEMDEQSRHFQKAAVQLGTFLCMKDMVEGRQPSVPGMRRQQMVGMHELQDVFADAEESDAFGGVYAELARSMSGMLRTAGPQFAGGYGVLELQIDCFDHFSSLGRHTSGATHDPRDLKDPNQKIAYFVIYPPARMETFAPQLATTLTYLFDTVASVNGKGTVTAIIDEAGAICMPKLAKSMNLYRKMRLRVVLIWQDLAGQAEKAYGRATVRELMAASFMKVFIGVQEPQTLAMASKLCGTREVADVSLNDRDGVAGSTPGLSQQISHRSVPLLRDEDVRMLGSDELLVIVGNVPPLRLEKVPYWENPEWIRRAGPSPYYQG